jgi:hypothetical protein
MLWIGAAPAGPSLTLRPFDRLAIPNRVEMIERLTGAKRME